MPETTGGLTDEIVAARPGTDHAVMEEVRAKAEQALFGKGEPARLGRFVLLEPIAGGGMGMIHRAYDPQLERTVAIKLVHPRRGDSEASRKRLLGEARLLAQLSHPHVVSVYEVDEIENQVVLVMELVEGKTLAAWERERQRHWRDILDVYLQAGRGLAAAHDRRLVHRDFKPTNAVVGNDGRVRVLDFGLARVTDAAEPVEGTADAAESRNDAPPHDVPAPGLTVSGELLGTIAYMSPEQLAGHTATAASDQFSFCVALYRALYGEPPFVGQDVATLLDNISAGRIRPAPEAHVPSWLRAAVARGLAAKPEDRHASMRVLLDLLARDRGWRRWRWVVLSAGMATLALASTTIAIRTATTTAGERPMPCDGGVQELARAWTPQRSQRISDALTRIATPYAESLKPRIMNAIDTYRQRWSEAHVAACRDRQRYPSLYPLADLALKRRMQCLTRRLQDLDSTMNVLGQIDSTSVTKALDVAVQLPSIRCADLDVFSDDNTPSIPDEIAPQVDAIQKQLSDASALERSGRFAEAIDRARLALKAAENLAYPPTTLDALMENGRILIAASLLAKAIPPLARAEKLALELRQLSSAITAGARRIYATAVLGNSLDRLAGHIDVLEPLSLALQSDRPAQALLSNYIGVFDMARGHRESAYSHFLAAQRAIDGIPDLPAELVNVDMNLAMVTAQRPAREELGRKACQWYREHLGPNHLTTLSEVCRYAHYLHDPVAALARVREADQMYRLYHPERLRGEQLQDWSLCVTYQAFLLTELGEPQGLDTAASLYEEIIAFTNSSTDDDVVTRRQLAEGRLELLRNRPTQALVPFKALLARLGKSPNWWDQQIVAQGDLGAGLAEWALAVIAERGGARRPAVAHLARAQHHLDRAIAILADVEVAPRNEDVEMRQHLALARLSLAAVLRLRSGAAAESRARALRAEAAAFYREANAVAYRHRLAEP